MVTNAPPEFFVAKKKFEDAKTVEDKLNALYEMLKYAPKHKGSANLLSWIKKEISKYKDLLKKDKKKTGKIKLIEKKGDILVSILGIENSGKSYFLRKFTNANVEVSEIPFSTKSPAIGTIFYKGVYYQFVEIPSTFKSMFRSILSISDFFLLILSNKISIEEQINRINSFSKDIVYFENKEKENYIILYNNFNDFSDINIENILEKIIEKLKLIRVFPINSNRCVLLKRGETVKDFIEKINKKLLYNFEYAKIRRKNNVLKAGLKFVLEDMDIVEIKTKTI